MIIIIGLPGSGKTTYFKNNLIDKYELFDDFISTFFNGELIEKIKEKKELCLIDPRLCNYDLFINIMNEIIKYINKSEIKLLLFENNPKKCIINSKKRINKNVDNMINIYSNIYIIDNYKKYNYEILKIFE